MNLTDVDDKTIKGSNGKKKEFLELGKKYAKAFFEDAKELNIEPPRKYTRATKHIKEMVELIRKLIEKDYAYKTEDGIFYNVSKFKDYGKLAHLNLKGLKAGARVKVDQYEKEQANDFALWKAYDKEDNEIYWDAAFWIDGEKVIVKGRPGWHIECSAMSMKYLGESFDIHTGGIDLIFPHHENEIAQSEAATGKKFVKYWVHNEHLLVDGKKMAKSLSNFYTLRDLLKKGYKADAIRFLLLGTHYKQQLNFTLDGVKAAENSVSNLRDFIDRVKEGKDSKESEELVKKVKKDFEKALDDDLNISEALAAIFEFVHKINKIGGGKKVYEVMLEFDKVLGLNLGKEERIPAEIKKLVDEREKARKEKDFEKADRIREDIKKKGYILEDSDSEVRVKKI